MTVRNEIRSAARGPLVWVGAALIAVLFCPQANVLAQDVGNPAAVDSSASVKVLKPITIEEITPLYFGKVISSTNGDFNTFSLTEDGLAAIGGGGNGQAVKPGTIGRYIVSFSEAEPITQDLANGFPTSCTNNGDEASVNLLVASNATNTGAGEASWTFTGTLRVESDTPPGVYTCTYTISAEYS